MSERLIRRYVRSLLSEDIGDGGYYGDIGMGANGGVGGWGGKNVASIFLSPFLDVFDTAVGSAKEVLAKAKGVIHTTLEAALAMVLPFVSGEYDEIEKATNEEVRKIRNKYAEVYKKNWDAFFQEDILILSFMLNPAAVVTSAAVDRIARGAPDAAVGLLGFFVPVTAKKSWDRLMHQLDPERLQRFVKIAANPNGEERTIVWSDRNRRRLYSHLRQGLGIEAPKPGASPNPLQDFNQESKTSSGPLLTEDNSAGQLNLSQLLADPQILDVIKSSPQAKELRSEAKRIMTQKLMAISKRVETLLSATDLDSLSQALGQQLPKVDDASLSDEERKLANDGVYRQMHGAIKKFFVKKLQDELKSLSEKGVDPEKVGVAQAYNTIIEKISSMEVNNAAPQDTVAPRGNRNGEEHGNRESERGDAAGRAQRTQGSDGGVHQKAEPLRHGDGDPQGSKARPH